MFYAIILVGTIIFSSPIVEKSGCCSHHGGVCGCASNGHQLCCDGKPSPTCMCGE